MTKRRDRNPRACAGAVVLRRWRREDLDAAASWGAGGGLDVMDAAARDAYFRTTDGRERSHHFAAEDVAGKLLGLVSVTDIHPIEGIAYNVTGRFSPEARERGFVEESLRMLLGWCFGELHLSKVCAAVPLSDVRLVEAHEACGFRTSWEFWQPAPDDLLGPGTKPTLDGTLSYITAQTQKTYVKYAVMEATAHKPHGARKEDDDV